MSLLKIQFQVKMSRYCSKMDWEYKFTSTSLSHGAFACWISSQSGVLTKDELICLWYFCHLWKEETDTHSHMYLPQIWHLLNWDFNRLLSNKHKPPWKAWILIGLTGQSHLFIYFYLRWQGHSFWSTDREKTRTQELHKWNMSKSSLAVQSTSNYLRRHSRSAFPQAWKSSSTRGLQSVFTNAVKISGVCRVHAQLRKLGVLDDCTHHAEWNLIGNRWKYS